MDEVFQGMREKKDAKKRIDEKRAKEGFEPGSQGGGGRGTKKF